MQHETVQQVLGHRVEQQGGDHRRQGAQRRVQRAQPQRAGDSGQGQQHIGDDGGIGGVGGDQFRQGHAAQVVGPGAAAAQE